MAKGSASTFKVKIEENPSGMRTFFVSNEMRDMVEKKAQVLAERKTRGAAKHLKGKMPTSGLYGYRMKHGAYKWMAVIYPKNRAAYAIGKKYGVKNL